MTLDYINSYYRVNAVKGNRVRLTFTLTPTYATITGAHGCYLKVRYDGQKKSVNIHPTWKVEYL